MKFSPGRLVWTKNINDCMVENAQFAKFVPDSLARHCMGDWGEITESDKVENDFSLSTCGYSQFIKKISS